MTHAILSSAAIALFIGLFVVFIFVRRLNYSESFRVSIKACAKGALWWSFLFLIFCVCVHISFFGAMHFWKTFL